MRRLEDCCWLLTARKTDSGISAACRVGRNASSGGRRMDAKDAAATATSAQPRRNLILRRVDAALGEQRVTVKALLSKPKALVALVPQPAALFVAGALAGALAKTASCPLDRTKLLMQVGGGTKRMAEAASSGSVVRTFLSIGREEGLLGYFKGNVPQVRELRWGWGGVEWETRATGD